jgi:L-asparaginase II
MATQQNHAPLSVKLVRGSNSHGDDIVECEHSAIIAVVDGDGKALQSFGDTSALTHMRSTLKPFQAMPLLDDDFFQKNGATLSLADLALFMSSHAGQAMHTTRVAKILASYGLSESDLKCGAHSPQDFMTHAELAMQKVPASALHNNCSGKHCALLLLSQERAFDHKSYTDKNHPIQALIKTRLAHFSGIDHADFGSGFDGCSLQSYAIPQSAIALAYARLALWQSEVPTGMPTNYMSHTKLMWQATSQFPDFLAGSKKYDSALIKASSGQIFSKSGADGLQALSHLPSKDFPRGLGIVIKVSDGDASMRIRPLLTRYILEKLNIMPVNFNDADFLPATKNYMGISARNISIK